MRVAAALLGDGACFRLLGQWRGRCCYEGWGGYTPANKGMKLTNLSAAPGTHTDRSAASCPRMDATGGGTGSQLIPGVVRTWGEWA